MCAQPRHVQFPKVVCIGAGNIGAGWAAHFLRAGLEVVIYDPVPERKVWVDDYLARAMPNLKRLGLTPGADTSLIRFSSDLEDALNGARFIQESSPEDLSSKIALIARITELAPADAIIASSSAGFLARDLRSKAIAPERIIIGHPFNPPYLIPLVEIAGGEDAPAAAASAAEFYKSTGCEVIELRREIEGYIGNRIQAAVLKEVMFLYSKGAADLATIDRAISAGPALRWAVMGPSSIFFLGTQNPSSYGDFVRSLVAEIKGGFVADADFVPNDELIEAYAEEVKSTIGSAGQLPLIETRTEGVIGVRRALVFAKNEHLAER
ncbi:3-hydroxyacyl-CoA dehydrogenase NAD-binding domain-containing protein [Rhizobium mongolense]